VLRLLADDLEILLVASRPRGLRGADPLPSVVIANGSVPH
jgi:hypothetical protein